MKVNWQNIRGICYWLVRERLLYSCIHEWISATSSEWEDAEFLQHPVYEWSQNFCNTLWMSGCRISATLSEWVVAEFLQHPVYEWSQNFCNTQGMSCHRISATPSVWVVAEFLRHSEYEWSQNFCNIQCVSGSRISATSRGLVVAEFLRHSVWEVAEFLQLSSILIDLRFLAKSMAKQMICYFFFLRAGDYHPGSNVKLLSVHKWPYSSTIIANFPSLSSSRRLVWSLKENYEKWWADIYYSCFPVKNESHGSAIALTLQSFENRK